MQKTSQPTGKKNKVFVFIPGQYNPMNNSAGQELNCSPDWQTSQLWASPCLLFLSAVWHALFERQSFSSHISYFIWVIFKVCTCDGFGKWIGEHERLTDTQFQYLTFFLFYCIVKIGYWGQYNHGEENAQNKNPYFGWGWANVSFFSIKREILYKFYFVKK